MSSQARRSCRMSAHCCDKPAYLVTHQALGTPYPAMSMIVVADLLNNPGKTDLQATAALPAAWVG